MLASLRKQMRQRPNLRMYARGRPQLAQRWCSCVENRDGRSDFAINDFFAISVLPEGHAEARQKRLALSIGAGGGHEAHLETA